jgi:hypothetical protein
VPCVGILRPGGNSARIILGLVPHAERVRGRIVGCHGPFAVNRAPANLFCDLLSGRMSVPRGAGPCGHMLHLQRLRTHG